MVYFRQIHDSRSHSYTYLLAGDGRNAIIIDPVASEVTIYLSLLDEIKANLSHILLTHAHGADCPWLVELQQATGARLVVGARCPLGDCATAIHVSDGDVIVFGDESLRCLTTPGHTLCGVSYLWRDRVFTGDTLPVNPEVCDGSSDENPGALFDSLTRKILTLPDETLVYPGHDFAGRRVSCIAEERASNSVLKGTTRDEFIAKYHAAAVRNELLRSLVPPTANNSI
jgi:glyoxylase-like metal-dependent hydrolase (beta-lactamase superfamily II)